MKRRSQRAPMKPTQKVTPFTASEMRDLLATMPKDTTMAVGADVFVLGTDNKPLDLYAVARSKVCEICGSVDVGAHMVVPFAQTLGNHADPAAVQALVLSICYACEEQGPDVFGPVLMEKLRQEGAA